MATKICAGAAGFVAIVELGDVALAERLAELQEAARLFRDLHGQQRFALRAEIGALGDVAQAIEVHVRAAVDADDTLALHALARDPLLHARDRERARRLDDGACVFEHVLDRRADLVCIDEQDLVDELATQLERLFADALHRHAIREDADALERDALAGANGLVHRRRILRLHADDAHVRIQIFHVGRDAADEAAAADRNEDGIRRRAALTQDLDADGALAGDHVRVVERVHVNQIALALELRGVLERAVVVVAMEHDFAAERPHRLDLDVGRGERHHDDRGNAALVRGERHALRMIAGRGADDAALACALGEMRDPVVRAAQLERKDCLQILALQQHRVAETAR